MLYEFVFGIGGFRALLGMHDAGLVEVADFAVVVAVVLELVARPCRLVEFFHVDSRGHLLKGKIIV